MFDFGQHAGFIWASYGAAVLILGGMATWLLLERAALRRTLRTLEGARAPMPGEKA